MNENIAAAVNRQINEEFYSAYLYLAMAAKAEHESLPGLANWFKVQAREEQDHALGFYNHLVERGSPVLLTEIKMPVFNYQGPRDLLTQSLVHEKHITKCIHELYVLAEAEHDYALRAVLDWYVAEQVEEEASLTLLLDQIKMTGESGGAFYMFDKTLGKREYQPASIL